jgi:hypothetical protein
MLASMKSATILLLLALATLLAATTAVEAQYGRGVKPYYWESYQTRGPTRGYEGYVAPNYYCSYKRYPNRECSTDARGRERCRVVSWRLEQTCQ